MLKPKVRAFTTTQRFFLEFRSSKIMAFRVRYSCTDIVNLYGSFRSSIVLPNDFLIKRARDESSPRAVTALVTADTRSLNLCLN